MSCTAGPAPSRTRPMGCARKAAGSGKMAAAVLLAVGLRTARRALAAAGSQGAQVRSNHRDLGARRQWRVPEPARASRIIAESLTLPRVNFCGRVRERSDLAATASRNSRNFPVGTELVVLLAGSVLRPASAVPPLGSELSLGSQPVPGSLALQCASAMLFDLSHFPTVIQYIPQFRFSVTH